VGTLSEMAIVWATSQTEEPALPLVLLGNCWPPLVKTLAEQLIISDVDLKLLRFAANPEEAVQEIRASLQTTKLVGPGPQG
jgi:predicted Rossmann-fold nucleotide-binding protein